MNSIAKLWDWFLKVDKTYRAIYLDSGGVELKLNSSESGELIEFATDEPLFMWFTLEEGVQKLEDYHNSMTEEPS